MASKIKILYSSWIKIDVSPNGKKLQLKKAKNKLNIGAKKYKKKFAFAGTTISLIINLKPSANACRTPQYPTRVGPVRRCNDASSFRSATVKKAIQISNGTRFTSTIRTVPMNHL